MRRGNQRMEGRRFFASRNAAIVVALLIVAGGLVIASIPFFLGLIIVMPVLGHATWHLYRQIVPR